MFSFLCPLYCHCAQSTFSPFQVFPFLFLLVSFSFFLSRNLWFSLFLSPSHARSLLHPVIPLFPGSGGGTRTYNVLLANSVFSLLRSLMSRLSAFLRCLAFRRVYTYHILHLLPFHSVLALSPFLHLLFVIFPPTLLFFLAHFFEVLKGKHPSHFFSCRVLLSVVYPLLFA